MKALFYIAAGLSALVLIGCEASPELADLQAFVEEVKARPAASIEPLPAEQPYTPFIYLANDLPSPFYTDEQAELASPVPSKSSALEPDALRAKHFLESFSIGSLTMVGVLSNSRVHYALLRSENGVYKVAVGDYLGSNHGRVTAITASSLEVMEVIADGEGGWREQVQILMLQGRS